MGQDLSHLLVVLPAFSLVLREKRGREGKDRATGERCGNEEGEGVRGNHKKTWNRQVVAWLSISVHQPDYRQKAVSLETRVDIVCFFWVCWFEALKG